MLNSSGWPQRGGGRVGVLCSCSGATISHRPPVWRGIKIMNIVIKYSFKSPLTTFTCRQWASFSNIFLSFFWNVSYGLRKNNVRKIRLHEQIHEDKFMNTWKCVPTQQMFSELCSGKGFLSWNRVLVLLNLHTYTPRQLLIRARNSSDVCSQNRYN